MEKVIRSCVQQQQRQLPHAAALMNGAGAARAQRSTANFDMIMRRLAPVVARKPDMFERVALRVLRFTLQPARNAVEDNSNNEWANEVRVDTTTAAAVSTLQSTNSTAKQQQTPTQMATVCRMLLAPCAADLLTENNTNGIHLANYNVYLQLLLYCVVLCVLAGLPRSTVISLLSECAKSYTSAVPLIVDYHPDEQNKHMSLLALMLDKYMVDLRKPTEPPAAAANDDNAKAKRIVSAIICIIIIMNILLLVLLLYLLLVLLLFVLLLLLVVLYLLLLL